MHIVHNIFNHIISTKSFFSRIKFICTLIRIGRTAALRDERVVSGQTQRGRDPAWVSPECIILYRPRVEIFCFKSQTRSTCSRPKIVGRADAK